MEFSYPTYFAFRRLPNWAELEDAASDAYVEWRGDCALLHDAYDSWAHGGTDHAPVAFAAYERALDREERSASRYADLMKRVGHPPGVSLAHHLLGVPATGSS
jgi:hypothetical protein